MEQEQEDIPMARKARNKHRISALEGQTAGIQEQLDGLVCRVDEQERHIDNLTRRLNNSELRRCELEKSVTTLMEENLGRPRLGTYLAYLAVAVAVMLFIVILIMGSVESNKHKLNLDAEAIKNGLEQKVVKMEGYSPYVIWVKPEKPSAEKQQR